MIDKAKISCLTTQIAASCATISTMPRLTPSDLADLAGVTPATCARRLDKMQAAGVIRANRAVIDWRALGYEVEVSLRITLDKTNPRAFDEFTESRAERAGSY